MDPEIRYLGDLQRLSLSPGDFLVLTVEDRISDETASRIRHQVESRLNGHTCFVLGGGMKFAALNLGKEGLTFAALRAANTARLPQFKNALGNRAHSKADGSDWSPAQWLQAVVGELGEYANLRKKFERGDIDEATFFAEAEDELADVQTYLDLLSFQLHIDLGAATASKFNRVSERVGSDVRLEV